MTAPQPTAARGPTTILIIDLATSGYREATDAILEVACILVDAGTLEVIDTHTSLVRPDPAAQPPQVPDFHEALLKECCAEGANSLRAVEGFLLAGPWTTADIVCNRALDFDLRFLVKHMPTLARALAKKLPIELKALERLHTATGGKPFVDPYPRTYRAGDDAIAALGELGWYHSALRTGVAS